MITVIIKYSGTDGSAKKFANEMVSSRLVDRVRAEKGNLQYEYYLPIDGGEYVVLIDSWVDQRALDEHHRLPLMSEIAQLRDKYDLKMEVKKYEQIIDDKDEKYIRR